MAVRKKFIRTLVEEILSKHQIRKAPISVDKLAKGLGVSLQREPTDDGLSGFFYKDLAEGQVVIGVNSNHHENRQRFTIAHELGHFLLHENQNMHIDREDKGFQIKLRDDKASEGTDDDEREANLFAAELLMPETFLEKDLSKIRGFDLLAENEALDKRLVNLAKKYQVSTQALTFRLANLGYIS